MIYTLGYQALDPAGVRENVLALDAVLFDCRLKPMSRIPGFCRRQLEALMQAQPCEDDPHRVRYVRMGHMLGGRGHNTDAGRTEPCPASARLTNAEGVGQLVGSSCQQDGIDAYRCE